MKITLLPINSYEMKTLIQKHPDKKIVFLDQQTEEICLEAVKQNGWALQFVIDQTPEICLAAVAEDKICYTFCKI